MSLRIGLAAAVLLWANGAAAQQPAPAHEPTGSRFSGRVSIAGAVRGLHAEPLFGAELEVGMGARIRDFMWVYGTISYMRAETRFGIDVHRPALGAGIEFDVAERLHLGLAPQIGLILVERVTEDELIWGLGMGLDLLGSLDLWQGDYGDALFLGLRVGGHYNGAPYYGGALSFGYRF